MPLAGTILSFDKFWKWLQGHPNCILGAGTPEMLLFDADDFHWHFAEEEDGTLLVQVLRGKQVVGEIAVAPRTVTYVQVEAKEEEEFLFECVTETETERIATYQFTLSHAYDAEESAKPGRWVH